MEVIGQCYIPAALSPGKRPRYPFNGGLDEPQILSARFGEEKLGLCCQDTNSGSSGQCRSNCTDCAISGAVCVLYDYQNEQLFHYLNVS